MAGDAKYVVVDLDGTVYLGANAIPGSVEALRLLAGNGYTCVFVTNNPLSRRDAYVRKLRGLGVDVDPEQVLTSSEALATWLVSQYGAGAVTYLAGEAALREELEAAGLKIVDHVEGADVVALGWDREFTYAKLAEICRARTMGIPVVATNPDPTCPTPEGEVPDCGALIAAIETASGRPIEEVVGKPSARMVELAVGKFGGVPSECWVVGDRLQTDVRMAHNCGGRSALVLSGATSRATLEASALQPTVVCDDLYAFAMSLS